MKKLFVVLLTLSITLFGASKFMMPDEAFKPKASINSQMQIEATVEIADEIYLYAEQLKLEVKEGSGISISKVEKPESVLHHEEMVYLESPKFLITLQKNSKTAEMQNIEFVLSYQGCSEQGLCYEPLSETYSFEVDTNKLELASTVKSDVETKDEQMSSEISSKEESVSETDAIANTIKSGNITLVLLTFLGFGLLLALTPCVFPMIPIISGVIISQGEGITTRKAFGLSVVYVLAMAVAYTIAGVLAGLFGANLQAALQTPWVIYSFAGVFVILAFSMFGFYELKLPDSFVAKVSKNSNKGGYIGVAIMGFLSALIVGPCVAAPLAGALVYIGQTGDAILGGLALFFMSIGMGIPLIAVGVSAGRFMPKPGEWMTMVTAIFGVMMLFVAVWMLERVVDEYVTMLLYAMLGIGFAIYLGAFERESHIFKRSVALISFIYFVALLIGALGGSTSMTKPLSFLQSTTKVAQVQTQKLDYTTVKSISELDVLLAKHKGRKIMLDFYASWCVSCKELDGVTFADARVKSKLSEFVFIKADVTQNSQEQKALSKKYGVFGPPALIFFDASSNVIGAKTIIGFVGPDELLAHLNQI